MAVRALDCKSMVYHPERQEVITPVHPNRLLRWDVSGSPQMIEEQTVPFHWQRIPQICRVGDRVAVVHPGRERSAIALRDWQTGQPLQRFELTHAPYKEQGLEDEFVGHEACSEVAGISSYPGNEPTTDIIVAEVWGDLQCVSTETGTVQRIRRRWTDYTGRVALDPFKQFLIVESTDQFTHFELYRIDDWTQDQLTYLGGFWGDVYCHRDRLMLQGNRLLHTFYGYKDNNRDMMAYLVCRQLDRSALATATEPMTNTEELPSEFSQTVWQRPFPYIQHPHEAPHPWQSDMAILNNEIVIYGAGYRLAEVDLAEGSVLAEYETRGIVQALSIDSQRGWALVATRSGVEKIELGIYSARHFA